MAMTQRGARDLVADITSAIAEGDYDAAARAASWGIESFPDAAVFHRLRGTALVALGVNEEAKANLNHALSVDPLDHEALVTLSRLEEVEGDLYTAAEHLLTAWEHDPANGMLRSDLTHRLARLYGSEGYLQYTRPALAALYVRNAYPERAAREYAAALAEQPTRVDLRLASVLARWRLGALTEATDGCVMLLDEQPQLVRARWALADALARRGRGEEARAHARHAALLDPDGAIARDLIESNTEATIVDPDEMVRVPLDTPRFGPNATALDPYEMPSPASPSSPAWRQVGNTWQPPAEQPAMPAAPEAEPDQPVAPFTTTDHAPITFPLRDEYIPIAPPAASNSPVAEEMPAPLPWKLTANRPQSTEAEYTQEPQGSWIAGESNAFAASAYPATDAEPDAEVEAVASGVSDAALAPPTTDEEPESVTAVVAENGVITTMYPGDEPALDVEDTFAPADEPEMPATAPEQPAAAIAAPFEPPVPPLPPTLPTLPTIPTPPTLPTADPQTPATLWPAMQAQLAAGDVPGALALGRAALAAAGKDPAQVRPLLPAMRSLVDAAPNRPDSRRLLGDTYRRLGQTAQAQGQYQQALLVRVAGKK